MRTIYVAGRMRCVKFYNFDAFFTAERQLKEQGWIVVNPARVDMDLGFNPYDLPEDSDWSKELEGLVIKDIVRRDVNDIIDKCDAMYMLTDWQLSIGANAEHALAKWLGLTITYEGK